jgi:hypothetical protein
LNVGGAVLDICQATRFDLELIAAAENTLRVDTELPPEQEQEE